jgi:hypothetical protein
VYKGGGRLGFMNLVKDRYVYMYIFFLDKQIPIGHTKSDALV